MYNLSSISNVTDILSFTQNVNTQLMDGWFGSLLLISICVIVFISFYFSTREIKTSILATSFISFGLSILLRAVELVPNKVLFITLIGAGISIAFTWKE